MRNDRLSGVNVDVHSGVAMFANAAEWEAYERRRQAAQLAIKAMGHGAGMRASYDTRTAPATISGVLTGRIVSAATLERIERWIAEQA